jgi:hypothetical protein
MSFVLSIITYLIMAAILIAGIILAVKGTFWLLIVGVIAFALAITKISLLAHH